MKRKTSFNTNSIWVSPTVILLFCFTIVPLCLLIIFSFMNGNIFAGGEWPGWTLNNFAKLFHRGTFIKLLLKSLRIGFIVTIACIIIAYPTAWAIAKEVKPQNRSMLMMIAILPFFTSQLLLIYAMMNLIQTNGVLLTFLELLGVHGQSILYTNKATTLVLIYEYVPYMILCLYSSLEGINDNLIKASLSLGAGKVRTFINIVFPMSLPGLLSGILLVLVPVCGSFAEANLVGGASGSMIGSLINSQYQASLNMGYGATLSFMLLVILSLIMAAVKWSAGRAQRRIGGDV